MGRKAKLFMLSGLAAAVSLVVVARARYSATAPVRLPAQNCNADLWKHVYEPQRLRVIEACTAVEGKVVSVHSAVDGDLHIGLDPDHQSVLNLINVLHAQQRLVVEIVCEHTPSDKGAAGICAEFVSQVSVPRVGDRIRITGAYVTDSDNGWNEIHPVSRIELLP